MRPIKNMSAEDRATDTDNMHKSKLVQCGADGRLFLSGFQALVTLTLTLDWVIRHTVVHHSSISMYTPNFIEIGKTFCGRTDVRTDGRTYWRTFQTPSNVIRSTRRSRPKNLVKIARVVPEICSVNAEENRIRDAASHQRAGG